MKLYFVNFHLFTNCYGHAILTLSSDPRGRDFMTFFNAFNGKSQPFRKVDFIYCPNCGRQIMNYIVVKKAGMNVFVCPKCNEEIPSEDMREELENN